MPSECAVLFPVGSKKCNPIALRKAKIVYSFGLSECNKVKGGLLQYIFSSAIGLTCMKAMFVHLLTKFVLKNWWSKHSTSENQNSGFTTERYFVITLVFLLHNLYCVHICILWVE